MLGFKTRVNVPTHIEWDLGKPTIHSFLVGCLDPCRQGTSVWDVLPQPIEREGEPGEGKVKHQYQL